LRKKSKLQGGGAEKKGKKESDPREVRTAQKTSGLKSLDRRKKGRVSKTPAQKRVRDGKVIEKS